MEVNIFFNDFFFFFFFFFLERNGVGNKTLTIVMYFSGPLYTITIKFRYFRWTKLYYMEKVMYSVSSTFATWPMEPGDCSYIRWPRGMFLCYSYTQPKDQTAKSCSLHTVGQPFWVISEILMQKLAISLKHLPTAMRQ